MVGRKRKPGRREKNGRIKRPSPDTVRQGDRALVLSQPHRLGDSDQRCASPFGRFCIRYKLCTEILKAGETYAATVRRWRAAKGIPTNESLGGGKGGDGPSDKTVIKWGLERMRCDQAMASASRDGWLTVLSMLDPAHDFDPGADQGHAAIVALMALADEMGIRLSRHPFLS